MHRDSIPRDLVAEVEAELVPARAALVNDDLRVTALEALLDVARALSSELKRPVTLVDVLATAPDPVERARRLQLARALRNRRTGDS